MRSENAPLFVDVRPRSLSQNAHELINVLNLIRPSSAVPDERLETFAGLQRWHVGAKVSSAKTVRLGHAAVEL